MDAGNWSLGGHGSFPPMRTVDAKQRLPNLADADAAT